ncbi:UNVERIFIED_CONTAM: hypothetical protein K2H54_067050 [Gekko kuhli]
MESSEFNLAEQFIYYNIYTPPSDSRQLCMAPILALIYFSSGFSKDPLLLQRCRRTTLAHPPSSMFFRRQGNLCRQQLEVQKTVPSKARPHLDLPKCMLLWFNIRCLNVHSVKYWFFLIKILIARL